jgi:DNA-binding transcriptional ArsR family regulator
MPMTNAKPIERRPATRAEARALAHPLRLRILRLCLDEALTNRELADRLSEQPATVLYHVRTLVKTGFLVREAERRGRRGARELPYRSTRKSWTLSFEGDAAGHLAMIDAARAELAEAGQDALLELVRLGVRVRPDRLAEIERAIVDLVAMIDAADDPAGDPIGLLIAVHRRR